MQGRFHDIFKAYKNKVVFISTEKNVSVKVNPFANDPHFQKFFGPNSHQKKEKKLTGLGTGFILSRSGYLCTNRHVVAKVDSVRVRVAEKEYTAKVIGQDVVTDIALLKVDNPQNFDPVYFGDSDQVQVGDWAIAIGNPFGFDKTFTVGVVSAVRGDKESLGSSYIQTDASINQGNSGGPLLNLDGEVIGVNRMIFAKSGGGSLGIGFAIPINTVKVVLEQLYAHGKVKWGFIGVQVASLNRGLARRLGTKSLWGALVVSVLANGPAHAAGLQIGDLILRVGPQRIKNSSHLVRTVSRMAIGSKVVLQILRKKKTMELTLLIGERP